MRGRKEGRRDPGQGEKMEGKKQPKQSQSREIEAAGRRAEI